MGQTFNVLIEKGQDGYLIADVIELPGCRTQAKTQDELMARVKEAIAVYLDDKPEITTKFLGVRQVEV